MAMITTRAEPRLPPPSRPSSAGNSAETPKTTDTSIGRAPGTPLGPRRGCLVVVGLRPRVGPAAGRARPPANPPAGPRNLSFPAA